MESTFKHSDILWKSSPVYIFLNISHIVWLNSFWSLLIEWFLPVLDITCSLKTQSIMVERSIKALQAKKRQGFIIAVFKGKLKGDQVSPQTRHQAHLWKLWNWWQSHSCICQSPYLLFSFFGLSYTPSVLEGCIYALRNSLLSEKNKTLPVQYWRE